MVPDKDLIHVPSQGAWKISIEQTEQAVSFHAPSMPLLVLESIEGGKTPYCLIRFGPEAFESCKQLAIKLDADMLVFSNGSGEALSVQSSEWLDSDALSIAIGKQFKHFVSHSLEKRCYICDVSTPRGQIVNGFKDIADFVAMADARGFGRDSIFYLPGWDGPYDGTYPDYDAWSTAGGKDELLRLRDVIHDIGGRLVLHLNHAAVSADRLPDYPELKNARIKDDKGSWRMWPGATWSGATQPLYYINPNHPAWKAVLFSRLERIQGWGINHLFMDQIGPMGIHSLPDLRLFLTDLRSAFPKLRVGGESFSTSLQDLVDFWQFWGPPWCGMPALADAEPSDLFFANTQADLPLFGHLGTPGPLPSLYSWTNFPDIVEHGAKAAFHTACRYHQKVGVRPTIRINAFRSRDFWPLVEPYLQTAS
ncbi:MAG: hypothetical protein JJU20_00450 [Opitutales bacterium]|nr:hypothetical protein [Opitutales bacterium]